MRLLLVALAAVGFVSAAEAQNVYGYPTQKPPHMFSDNQPYTYEDFQRDRWKTQNVQLKRAVLRRLVQHRTCGIAVSQGRYLDILAMPDERPEIEAAAETVFNSIKKNCQAVKSYVENDPLLSMMLGVTVLSDMPEVREETSSLLGVIGQAFDDAMNWYRNEMPRDGLSPSERMERQSRENACQLKAEVGIRC